MQNISSGLIGQRSNRTVLSFTNSHYESEAD